MRSLVYLIYKDGLLLWRDKIGLVILFLMPMFFILTITLLQAQKPQTLHAIPIIIANEDPELSFQNTHFNISLLVSPTAQQVAEAKTKVAQGQAKLLILIPQNAHKHLLQNTQTQKIQLFFDPGISPVLQATLLEQIKKMLLKEQLQALSELTSEALGSSTPLLPKTLPLAVHYAGGLQTRQPSAVEQNVPAWALFGMFFIALPLASIMLKEKDQALGLRFHLVPVSAGSFLAARILAFILVNLLQLCLMFLVGIFVLPWFGLPALDLSGHWGLILLIGLFSAWAATSFGLFIGTLCRTIEQVAALTPLLIILAAALGGIMLPLYLMPPVMQAFAAYSPLHWGQQAFLEVLLRQGHLHAIFWPLFKLALFSILFSSFACWRRRSC